MAQNRTCVAPYFDGYGGEKDVRPGTEDPKEFTSSDFSPVRMVVGDFNVWTPPTEWDPQPDVVVCSQVIEHVDDPGKFMQKLLASAPTVIVSAPYLWDDGPDKCPKCDHKSNKISEETMLQWAAPRRPAATSIVDEGSNREQPESFDRRIVMLFRRDGEHARPPVASAAPQDAPQRRQWSSRSVKRPRRPTRRRSRSPPPPTRRPTRTARSAGRRGSSRCKQVDQGTQGMTSQQVTGGEAAPRRR